MKRLLLTAAGILAVAAPGHAGELAVQLSGVRDAGGTLYVSVQGREEFMERSGTAGSVVSLPGAGIHRFNYAVPEGEYAITVWHDDNGNGRFDQDENHMPLDGWAMPNADQLRGAPAFDDVKTLIGEEPATVNLSMNYAR